MMVETNALQPTSSSLVGSDAANSPELDLICKRVSPDQSNQALRHRASHQIFSRIVWVMMPVFGNHSCVESPDRRHPDFSTRCIVNHRLLTLVQTASSK